MKLQLKNAKNIFEDKVFGDEMYDPISVKKLSKEEREVYQAFKITHEMDMRSFLMMSEIFMMKSLVDKSYTVRKEKEKLLSFPSYDILKGLGEDSVNAVEVWSENIYQRNSKQAYVKCLEFFQSEVPILNYHFYNMVFTRLNATNIEEWQSSFYLIEPYMKAVQDFREKMNEMIQNITYKYNIKGEDGDYLSFLFDGKNKSKESAFFLKIYKNIKSEINNVFWNKNRKKEDRYNIINSAIDLFKENMMLINFHFAHYKNLHRNYTVSALKSIRENNEKLNFSLIDEVENINYNQFFFEAILTRSLSNIFDPVDSKDIHILKEFGVHGYDLKTKAIQLKYTNNLVLYKERQGGKKMYEGFERIYRELYLFNKIDEIDIGKNNITKKKKI